MRLTAALTGRRGRRGARRTPSRTSRAARAPPTTIARHPTPLGVGNQVCCTLSFSSSLLLSLTPTPYTLHPTPYTPHPTPYILPPTLGVSEVPL